jgi:hypothetical protein
MVWRLLTYALQSIEVAANASRSRRSIRQRKLQLTVPGSGGCYLLPLLAGANFCTRCASALPG